MPILGGGGGAFGQTHFLRELCLTVTFVKNHPRNPCLIVDAQTFPHPNLDDWPELCFIVMLHVAHPTPRKEISGLYPCISGVIWETIWRMFNKMNTLW